jgi:hypothetical protein
VAPHGAFGLRVSLYCGSPALSTATAAGVKQEDCQGRPGNEGIPDKVVLRKIAGINLGNTKGGETFENPAYADDQV